MAQWLLDAMHYIEGQMLDKGTVVGDDTPHPIEKPSPQMLPLDDDAMAKSNALLAEIGHDAPGSRAPFTEVAAKPVVAEAAVPQELPSEPEPVPLVPRPVPEPDPPVTMVDKSKS